MVSNVAGRRISPALALLLACAAGALLVQLILMRYGPGNPRGFSPIFAHLLNAYDTHGNLLLGVLAVLAFLQRREPAVLAAVRIAGDHPWRIAAAAFVLLCAGSLLAYHAHPLSMDEYLALFQAGAFAGGHLAGRFPPPLLEHAIPTFFQGFFFVVQRATGDAAASYWPGFGLLLAPFAWLGASWALNPLLGALTLPALHRLTRALTGSREAAGWAVLLCAASPAFVATSISYYSMPAHLLCSLLFALLLLQPTPRRALLAGAIGSLALTLHNPVPHLLFAAAFLAWLALQRRFAALGALLAGYLPLVLLLGFGWHYYLGVLSAGPAAAAATAAAGAQDSAPAAAAGASMLGAAVDAVSRLLTLPRPVILEARLAGLTKIWTWGAAGLLVLAAWGFAVARSQGGVRLLAAAFAITFFGYFFVPFDQGHGWGYRYIYSAWFVLPLFAAIALARPDGAPAMQELRNMACWAAMLSLLAANGLRLVQVESFIARQLNQVPPLARAASAAQPEVVFVDISRGFYVRDLVQNHPFLRAPRITLVYRGEPDAAALMAEHFPAYRRKEAGAWGELWTGPQPAR
jgi:hypothetical protein